MIWNGFKWKEMFAFEVVFFLLLLEIKFAFEVKKTSNLWDGRKNGNILGFLKKGVIEIHK